MVRTIEIELRDNIELINKTEPKLGDGRLDAKQAKRAKGKRRGKGGGKDGVTDQGHYPWGHWLLRRKKVLIAKLLHHKQLLVGIHMMLPTNVGTRYRSARTSLHTHTSLCHTCVHLFSGYVNAFDGANIRTGDRPWSK